MSIKIPIDYDKIFYTNNANEPYKIIEDLGMVDKVHKVLIRFINDGEEKIASYQQARKGEVRRNSRRIDMNKTYTTNNCGDIIIIDKKMRKRKYNDNNESLYTVQFVDTGSIVENLHPHHILNGTIKDPYKPCVYGVGYTGDLRPYMYKREYRLWKGIIDRCYNKKSKFSYKRYGAIGVKVVERWHNFSTFVRDLPSIPNYKYWIADTNRNYAIDKDYLQINIPVGQRVYSKDTCYFLCYTDNVMLINRTGNRPGSYFGVDQFSDCYKTSINVGNYTISELFTNEIAAANFYNYMIVYYYGDSRILNSVPYMDWYEVLRYIKDKRVMCKIVSK